MLPTPPVVGDSNVTVLGKWSLDRGEASSRAGAQWLTAMGMLPQATYTSLSMALCYTPHTTHPTRGRKINERTMNPAFLVDGTHHKESLTPATPAWSVNSDRAWGQCTSPTMTSSTQVASYDVSNSSSRLGRKHTPHVFHGSRQDSRNNDAILTHGHVFGKLSVTMPTPSLLGRPSYDGSRRTTGMRDTNNIALTPAHWYNTRTYTSCSPRSPGWLLLSLRG